MKITKEQYDELDFLQSIDLKAFNKKVKEFLEVDVKPCTVYQYFYGDSFVGDSSDYTVRDLLHNMGVEIEK